MYTLKIQLYVPHNFSNKTTWKKIMWCIFIFFCFTHFYKSKAGKSLTFFPPLRLHYFLLLCYFVPLQCRAICRIRWLLRLQSLSRASFCNVVAAVRLFTAMTSVVVGFDIFVPLSVSFYCHDLCCRWLRHLCTSQRVFRRTSLLEERKFVKKKFQIRVLKFTLYEIVSRFNDSSYDLYCEKVKLYQPYVWESHDTYYHVIIIYVF